MTSLILTATQKAHLAIAPVDSFGNPATVENVVWASSNEDVLEVVPDADGLGAWVSAVGPVGVGQVVVDADALIGEGVEELSGVLAVEVVAAKAVALGISFSAPEEK